MTEPMDPGIDPAATTMRPRRRRRRPDRGTGRAGAADRRLVRPASRGLLLDARGITKRFGGLVAVRTIDFDIPEGSIVSLIGPNGAGKTTFFNVIAGLLEPSEGTISFAGEPVVSRPRRTWAEPFFWFALPGRVRRLRRREHRGPPRDRRRAAGAAGDRAPDRLAHRRDHPAAVVRAPPAAGRDLPQRAAQRDGALRDRPDVPEHPAVREHVRPRERAGGHAQPHGRDAVRRRVPRCRGTTARRRRPIEKAREWLAYVGLKGRDEEVGPQPARTATSAGSRSPGRSPATPGCCCSTSRRPA